MKAFKGTVRGRVQGVGFRYSTRDVAIRLGLHGWVRNTPDGAVSVFAQGEEVAIDRFLEYLQEGPRVARVDAVMVDVVDIDLTLDRFEIR
ncbi:MAG: acylphosphatase [Acidimicrobiia bacterium]|nr:acylphosphatase [Acidimicrobiia bacterium]